MLLQYNGLIRFTVHVSRIIVKTKYASQSIIDPNMKTSYVLIKKFKIM